jgi:predicted TIM-barrel fold metal-dependent hydrolase
VAACPNVVAKLGGLAMPDNGFGWHLDPAERPDANTFVAAQERWFHHTIECFGPDRCMFESNFPVDKLSIDYDVLFNALKTIASRYTDEEQDAMFSGTARRVYRL